MSIGEIQCPCVYCIHGCINIMYVLLSTFDVYLHMSVRACLSVQSRASDCSEGQLLPGRVLLQPLEQNLDIFNIQSCLVLALYTNM